MADAGGIRAGQAFIELYANDSKLMQGLSQAQARVKAFAETVKGIGTGLTLGGGAITAPILAAAHVFASSGDQLDKMSARTGMSVEMLSTLGHSAKLAGAGIEDVETGIKHMQKAIVEASAGSVGAVTAFAKLGMTGRDLKAMSTEQQFQEIGAALGKITDPAERSAIAMELFGRSGTSLIPLAQNLDAARAEIDKIGGPTTTATAQSAAKLADAWDNMEAATKKLISTVGGQVAPILTDVADRMTEAIVVGKKWISQHGELIRSALMMGGAVTTAGTALVGFGFAVNGISSSISGVRNAYGLLNSLASIKLDGGIARLGSILKTAAFASFANEGTSAFSLVGKAFAALGSKLSNAGGIGSILSRGFDKAAEAVIYGLDKIAAGLSSLPSLAAKAFEALRAGLTALPSLISNVAKALSGLRNLQIFSTITTGITAAITAIQAAFAGGGLLGVLGLFAAKIGAVFAAIGTALAGVTLPVWVLVALIAAAVYKVGQAISIALDTRAANQVIDETTKRVQRLRNELHFEDKAQGRGVYMTGATAKKQVDEYIRGLIAAGKTEKEVYDEMEVERQKQLARHETFKPAWKPSNAHSQEFYQGQQNESWLLAIHMGEAIERGLGEYKGFFSEVARLREEAKQREAERIMEETGELAKEVEKRKEKLKDFMQWQADEELEKQRRAAAFDLEKLSDHDPHAAMKQASEQYARALEEAAEKIKAANEAAQAAIDAPKKDVHRDPTGKAYIKENEAAKGAEHEAKEAQKRATEWEASLRSETSKYLAAQERVMDDQKEFSKRIGAIRRRDKESEGSQDFDARLRLAQARGSRSEGEGLKSEAEDAFRAQLKRAKELKGETEAAYAKAFSSGKKDDLQAAKLKAEEASHEDERVDALRERLRSVSDAVANGSFTRKYDIAGTFNASRLGNMGIGNTVSERAVKAAEETAKYIKWIWQIQNGDGTTFGY